MDNIVKELGISEKNVRSTSKTDTFVVVVQYAWLKQLMKYNKLDFNQKNVYNESWRISDNPLPPWTKTVIRVFPKQNGKVLPLPRSKLGSGKVDAPLSFSQVLSYVSQTNHRNLWKESYKKHSIHYISHAAKEQATVNVVDYSNLLYEVIVRLYGCNIIKIKLDPSDPNIQTSELVSVGTKYTSKVYQTHSNVLPVICAIDMEESIFLIHHSHYDFNLLDCIIFSPAVLDQSYTRCLFIIYQILQSMKSMYNRGLNFGEVSMEDIYIKENLWIQIAPQITSNIHIVSPESIFEHNKHKTSTLNEQFSSQSKKNSCSDELNRENKVALEKLCSLWVQGCLSNLDYLVHLNVVAGRRAGDPTAHHVLPWVTDFSSKCGKNWRDLTKSKYRLTKGDRQLDMTFEVMSKELHTPSVGPHQIPHHVSDVLSDITYYVYMARRTPKNILCQNVRYNWVPAEYPSSIQRMQEWTPDECIPEFFTDPTVFKSIHEDLADLELPPWATSVEDFVIKHREVLESSQVSESLHHWIDLTFGYKLSGTAAVKAKNVCLSLVDGHKELTRAGPVQLFACAHPARSSNLAHCWGAKLPPRIYWQREKKKVLKSNESSEDISDDEEDDSNLPQNYSSLSIPPNHRHSSRHKSSSRSRQQLRKSDEASSSTANVSQVRASSSSSSPHHFKVQKSEWGKGQIYLPKEYNPISQLSSIENLHNFTMKTFYKQAGGDLEKKSEHTNSNASITKSADVATGCSDNLTNVNQADMMCDENSFTNQMFVASYEQNLLKRQKTEDRNSNTKFVANAALFKQSVLANRKKDMQVLGCLIVEIFLHHKIRPFQVRASQSFDERYKVCRLVLKHNIGILPKCVRHIACLLLQTEDHAKSGNTIEITAKFEEKLQDCLSSNSSDINYPCVNKNGLPPCSAVQLLQPLLTNHLLPFPSHFPLLNAMIAVLHEYSVAERELNILYSLECDGQDCSKYQCFDKSKLYFSQKIAEAKVYSCSLQMENFFNQIYTYNQFDSVDLFIPHLVELLANKDTSILTAWYLFDPIAKALGPIEASKKLLNLILNLYDDHSGEKHENRNLSKSEPSNNTTTHSNKKSVKLYHNIFLLQLIVRFGLQCFLENFVPHLVEAVGGYKDTSTTEAPMHSHASTVKLKPATSLKKLTYCDDSNKTGLTPHDVLSPDTSCGSENTLTPCIEKDCSLVVDKSNKSICDVGLENEVFHIDLVDKERSGDADVPNSWETNLLNKSKIKCLIDDIDSAASSPNLDIYLNHTQALEATESICGIEEDDSSKSDQDQTNKCVDEIYFDDNNYGSSNNSPTRQDRKCGPTSPTIAIPSSHRTFKSYVDTPEDESEDPNTLSPNETKSASQSLELNKGSPNLQKQSKNSDKPKSSESGSSRRSTQLYLSCNNVKDYKISEMSSESLIWLAHRLGPVLTCKHLSRNLLKMLTLCYMGQENLMPLKDSGSEEGLNSLCIANSRLIGDCNATKVIECLTSIAALYGEQIILLQYFPHMGDLIASCRRRISTSLEGGLIACLHLLRFLIPYISDVKLMEQLQDIILKNILHPTVRLISSTRSTFPSGHVARSALATKFLDTLYVIALRIGPEMTKKHLCVPALQRFFLAFDKAHGSADDSKNVDMDAIQVDSSVPEVEGTSVEDGNSYLEICRDGSTTEWRVQGGQVCLKATVTRDSSASPPDQPHTTAMSALEELQSVFNAELAHQSYIPFYKFVGEETIDRSLKNHLTLRALCREYDSSRTPSMSCNMEQTSQENSDSSNTLSRKQSLNESNPVRIGMDVHLGRSEGMPCKTNHQQAEETSNSNSFGSNVAIIGNRIEFQSDPTDGDVPKSAIDIVSCKMENGSRSSRHLRGDWLMYWEHEIGRPDKDNRFNLKQIKLQTFSGHSNAVRNIVCLDNENSFMTGSKDKTIKLWSLRNQGDGSSVSSCQWTYTGHRKGILSLTFLESLRLTVSTDASVHIWDPYVESIVAQLDNSRSAPVSIVKAMPAPSALVLAATTDTVLRLIDARTYSYIHELKVSFNPNTFIRCMCVAPSGRWVALGLASGHLALLEPRTGALRAHWKAHDGEVLQLVAAGDSCIVSSSLDQTVLVWSATDGKLKFQLKGSTEPVHCLSTYYNELISGTTNNRIGVHTAVDQDASFSSTKLRSDTFKGVLTAMAVLPLNRMLLLGGESGNVSLLC